MTQDPEHELSALSSDMMLERHRAVLLETRWVPLSYRTQLVVVIVATWFLPGGFPWPYGVAALVTTLLAWTWFLHTRQLRYQLLTVEEAIASAAIADRKRRWEDSYIRFRHESIAGAHLAVYEPVLWWLVALLSVSVRLLP